MVNTADDTTSRRPGAAYWLLTLLALPLAGVLAAIALTYATDDVTIALAGAAVLLALLSAAVLPRLRRMRALTSGVRAGWTAIGVVLTVVLAGAEVFGLLLAVLVLSCRFGGTCLS
jgi:FtsH-binding integral membrane protein